jgi:histidyl-tRNA synthetase
VSNTLQAIRGMNDILPDEAERWLAFEATVQQWLARYGYRNIRMPLVEQTALFRRAIGEVTDIVEKEMYSWKDELNAEELTLRPEGTASCVRAAIEHSLVTTAQASGTPAPWHERPQGRYRQFHQYGVEALLAGPTSTPSWSCAALWKEWPDRHPPEPNTIGSSEERAMSS